MLTKVWEILPANKELQEKLVSSLNLSPLVAQILINRDLKENREVLRFLKGGINELYDPFLMRGIGKAVERIREAIEKGEQILLYGDYDVDGVCGTALLMKILKRIGAKVTYYIPQRLKEGYGLNENAISRARGNYNLIITIDCGISSPKEIALAQELGIEVIIVDHHEPGESLPPALAILNPKMEDSGYPFRELAGVGIAFKLAQALASNFNLPFGELLDDLDLVALGTVADVVPLVDENRILVKIGLEKLNQTGKVGLKALIQAAFLDGCSIDSGHIGYILAPRINASGRLGDAKLGVELLLTDSEEVAKRIAEILEVENRERQNLEERILMEAEARMGEAIVQDRERVFVLESDGWHVGVIGIVASRLVERYCRPAILISLFQGRGKGSARSIRGFSLFKALKECKDLLIKFGGHALAAGLTIEPSKIAEFKEAINAIAYRELKKEDLWPKVRIDAAVDLKSITPRLIEEISLLAPYGNGNPRPLLAAFGLKLKGTPFIVGKNHLKLKVEENGLVVEAIGFRLGDLIREFTGEDILLDLAFTPKIHEWQGFLSTQLELKDIKIKVKERLQIGLETPSKEGLFLKDLLYRSKETLKANAYLETGEEMEEAKFKEADQLRAELKSSSDREKILGAIRKVLSGEASYSEKQREAIENLLRGKNTLAIFGPGCGQSTLLQSMAAYKAIVENTMAIILYPLASLITAQGQRGERLRSLGLKVFWGSGLLPCKSRERFLDALHREEVDIALLTPQFLAQYREKFLEVRKKLGFLAITQAHGYGEMGEAIGSLQELGNPLILAVTSKAGQGVVEKIVNQLGIEHLLIDPSTWDNIRIIDKRNIVGNRNLYVANLVAMGEKTLIYVNSRAECVRLANILYQEFPLMGERGEIALYHGGLKADERSTIERLFLEGKVKVVVATGFFGEGFSIPDLQQIVFYNLGFSQEVFEQQIAQAGREGKEVYTHLIYGAKDGDRNRFLLEQLYPSRDSLAIIYKALKGLSKEGNRITKSEREIVAAIRTEGITETMVSSGLEILEELGLLSIEDKGGEHIFYLHPAPEEKLDLKSSLRYREGLQEKEEFNRFYEYALNSSPEELRCQAFINKYSP